METSTVIQPRPHEAYPEIVSALRLIEQHDGNPIWLATLRNEIDAALATERNTAYFRGVADMPDAVREWAANIARSNAHDECDVAEEIERQIKTLHFPEL